MAAQAGPRNPQRTEINIANRRSFLFMQDMKRNADIVVDLPVRLDGELLSRFSCYYRELAATDPDLTPSGLAAQLLSDILEADLIAEQPERLN